MESDAAAPHRHVVLLTRMLETGGCVVRAVGTGAEALRAIALARPCVVFLDVALPDMRAPDVVRRLGLAGVRNRSPSGDGDALARSGPDVEGSSSKPVDRRALLASVERHARCSASAPGRP